jgi:hypothetical protein
VETAKGFKDVAGLMLASHCPQDNAVIHAMQDACSNNLAPLF